MSVMTYSRLAQMNHELRLVTSSQNFMICKCSGHVHRAGLMAIFFGAHGACLVRPHRRPLELNKCPSNPSNVEQEEPEFNTHMVRIAATSLLEKVLNRSGQHPKESEAMFRCSHIPFNTNHCWTYFVLNCLALAKLENRTRHTSAALLKGCKACFHVLQIWVCLGSEQTQLCGRKKCPWIMLYSGICQHKKLGKLPKKNPPRILLTSSDHFHHCPKLNANRMQTIHQQDKLKPGLDVLVAVAELGSQFGLVKFDVILQLSELLQLLCAEGSLLVLTSDTQNDQKWRNIKQQKASENSELLGKACQVLNIPNPQTSFSFFPSFSFLVLPGSCFSFNSFMRATIFTISSSLFCCPPLMPCSFRIAFRSTIACLMFSNSLVSAGLKPALSFFVSLLGFFFASNLRNFFLLRLGHWSLRHHGRFGHEVSKLRLQALYNLAGIHILLFRLEFSHFLALGGPFLFVVLSGQKGSLILQCCDLTVDQSLGTNFMAGMWYVAETTPSLEFLHKSIRAYTSQFHPISSSNKSGWSPWWSSNTAVIGFLPLTYSRCQMSSNVPFLSILTHEGQALYFSASVLSYSAAVPAWSPTPSH